MSKEDAQVMTGAPEGSDPTPELGTGSASPDPSSSPGASAPGMQEVTIGGQTFAVTPAMAAAYQADRDALNVRVNDLQSGLEAARAAAITPSKAGTGVSPADTTNLGSYNWETKLFESPAEAMREAINIAKGEAKEEIRQEYAQTRAAETASKTFWDGFYQSNPHLKGREKVVDFIVQSNGDLASMSLPQAGSEIKARAEAFLKESGVTIPSGGNPPIVEGGPEKAPKTETPPAAVAAKGKSLGDVLKERSKQRAESRHGNIKVVK